MLQHVDWVRNRSCLLFVIFIILNHKSIPHENTSPLYQDVIEHLLSPDIPAVDWVVQVDCPEDVTTYIHRVGRTARYSKSGEAILLLTPSEEPAMLDCLKAKNIPIEKIE